MQLFNITRQVILLEEVIVAGNFYSRFIGLLGCRELPPGRGLLLKPCNSVHTLGMRFSIDVAFIDDRGILCLLIHEMPPCRISPIVRRASCVIEAPAGTFRRTPTRPGDILQICRILPPANQK